jgi:anaerobic ribonucleoside-triphosphate reductase activating protein
MLKYLYVKELFSEIPQEISLGISITGCKIHCKGCHSKELWDDIGRPLTVDRLNEILDKHDGVTCLLLLGGEHDISALTELFYHAHKRVKTAWYSGLDKIPDSQQGILHYLDYYKIGRYKQDLGGLNSKTTNQKLYKIEHQGNGNYWETDITYLLQKK